MSDAIFYTVRRHPRARSLKLRVSPFDGVVVTMPRRPGRWIDVDSFVDENRGWIADRLEECGLPASGERPHGSVFDLDRDLSYRGERYRIVPTDEASVSISEADREIGVPRRADDPNEELRSWLVDRAKRRIEECVTLWADTINVNPDSTTVRSLRSRWGSCTSDGRLVFNWRLILFPPSILEYVVLHEICHLRHFDHSESFWNLVEEHAPDFEESVEWLKTEGMRAGMLAVWL